jgi:NHL repeat
MGRGSACPPGRGTALRWLLPVALTLLGYFASPALATPGVDQFWGNIEVGESGGGRFDDQGVRGIGIYEATGDVYVADPGNNRIQQFDRDGNFIRAWGFDVNAPQAAPGSASFEICTVKSNCKAGVNDLVGGTNPGGELSGPRGIAVNQSNGHVYVVDSGFARVQEFTSTGAFVRAFGQDVVVSGAENAPAQAAKQTITVDATAGQFRLGFQGQTTADINVPTSAGALQAALQGLSSVGSGNVSVGGSGPYTVNFTGVLVNSPQPLIQVAAGTVPLSGGATSSVTVANSQTGSTGYEVCTVAASCKAGTGGTSSSGGVLSGAGYPAVAPEGAPNAGKVLVPDSTHLRIQEFGPAGNFIRAFGWDVVAAGPGNDTVAPVNEFEICRAANFDVCKNGSTGPGSGQFSSEAVNRIAEDRFGNVYTVEAANESNSGNFRVQKFVFSGDAIDPQGAFDCLQLCGTNSNKNGGKSDHPSGVAVDGDGFVYVVKDFREGEGDPPTLLRADGGFTRSQPRILKVDPAGNGGSGEIVETMLANPGGAPGIEGDVLIGGDWIESVDGPAVPKQGLPIYFNGGSRHRVYRVDEVPPIDVSTTAPGDVGATSATLEGTVAPAATPGNVTTFYHFEYRRAGTEGWLSAPTVPGNLGNGVAGGESDNCSLQNPAAVCHVSEDVDGLELGLTYEFRLVAATAYRGAEAVSAIGEFTTEPSPPVAVTGSGLWSSPPDSAPSLVLNGRLSAQGADTTYYFEYVSQAEFEASGFGAARTAPAVPLAGGHGVVARDVTVVAGGLDPTLTYRFRLVAQNASGTDFGDTGTVLPPQPDDRFYELVTDGDSQGGVKEANFTISDDGSRVMFTAVAFGEQFSAPWITNPNISQRGTDGWSVSSMGPFPGRGGGFEGFGDAEVTKRLWQAPGKYEFRNLDGSITFASDQLNSLDQGLPASLAFQGGSADLTTLAMEGPAGLRLFPDEPVTSGSGELSGSGGDLYAVTGAGGDDPVVSLVNRADDGTPLGGACGARLGGSPSAGESGGLPKTRAVSLDGSVIFFSARAGAPATGSCDTSVPIRIFKRVDQAHTVAVSQSQCTRGAGDPGGACLSTSGDDRYLGASADGSRVYFTTKRQLVGSPSQKGDTDTTSDLYLYDSSPPAGEPNLVQVSAGELVPGAAPGDPPAHEVGAGAEVLGVSDVSMDGSRVYFVAKGRLVDEAAAGANNLYVYERDAEHPEGRIGFVATLSASLQLGSDTNLWSPKDNGTTKGKPIYALPYYDGLGSGRTYGDGHLLVFASEAPLLPEDGDAFDDIYRYDDWTGELTCLSCSGDQPLDASIYGHLVEQGLGDEIQSQRIASEDGSKVIFSTKESLLPEDTNLARDVYLWDEGELSLVSSATGADGVVNSGGVGGGLAISPDGKTIFYETRATLLPQDLNSGGVDIYASRIGGGFPQPATVVGCTSEGACRGSAPSGGAAGEVQSPGSAGFSGPGNSIAKPHCGKGKVMRKGRCVKKPRRHKHKHKHPANGGRRPGR